MLGIVVLSRSRLLEPESTICHLTDCAVGRMMLFADFLRVVLVVIARCGVVGG